MILIFVTPSFSATFAQRLAEGLKLWKGNRRAIRMNTEDCCWFQQPGSVSGEAWLRQVGRGQGGDRRSGLRPLRYCPRGVMPAKWTSACSGAWPCWRAEQTARCRLGSKTGWKPTRSAHAPGYGHQRLYLGCSRPLSMLARCSWRLVPTRILADQMVMARLERQPILDRPDPPHVVVVLDERLCIA